IGDDIPHVRSRRVHRRPVHAAAEAVVHTVLDGLDRPAARAVDRIAGERADPRADGPATLVEVAAHAPQPVADMSGEAVARGGDQRASPADRDPQGPGRWLRVRDSGEGTSVAGAGGSGPLTGAGGGRDTQKEPKPKSQSHGPETTGFSG